MSETLSDRLLRCLAKLPVDEKDREPSLIQLIKSPDLLIQIFNKSGSYTVDNIRDGNVVESLTVDLEQVKEILLTVSYFKAVFIRDGKVVKSFCSVVALSVIKEKFPDWQKGTSVIVQSGKYTGESMVFDGWVGSLAQFRAPDQKLCLRLSTLVTL